MLEAKVGQLLAQLKIQTKEFEQHKASVQNSSLEQQNLNELVKKLNSERSAMAVQNERLELKIVELSESTVTME